MLSSLQGSTIIEVHATCRSAAGSRIPQDLCWDRRRPAGAPGADLRAVVIAAVALRASLRPGVPSCTVFPPVQYLRLQSVALRELSKTRQQGRTSTLWELIDRSASEPRGQQQDHFEAFSAGVMSVRPQKNRKSFNPSPQPLQVLHEVYSKLRLHWSCVNGLGILAHPTGSVRGHNLASIDKEMVYVT